MARGASAASFGTKTVVSRFEGAIQTPSARTTTDAEPYGSAYGYRYGYVDGSQAAAGKGAKAAKSSEK